MMDYTFEQYQASADTIRSRLGGFVPEVALVLGSGLGFLGDVVENAITFDERQRLPYLKPCKISPV